LAEKNQLLKEQKTALDSLQENHRQELMELKATQTESIAALQRKHQQDKIEMETILEETQKEAAKNPRKEVEEQLERILQDFEQAEHTFTVKIKDLEQSHQSELDHLEDDQKAQMKKLKSSQNMSRNSWTERYLPTDAVSWPQPHHNPKLKPVAPVSLVESKSKTLMRVLGNTTTKSQPVLTPIDNTKVQIYYSSVSTSVTVSYNCSIYFFFSNIAYR
jgi:hypothetical protein